MKLANTERSLLPGRLLAALSLGAIVWAQSAPSQAGSGQTSSPLVTDQAARRLKAVQAKSGEVMSIEDYQPRSTLVVPQHPVPRAKYPFIDIHSHHRTPADQAYLRKLLSEMDTINLRILVNLSGSTGDKLKKGIEAFREASPDRLKMFANLDFSAIDEPDYGRRAAAQLEEDVKNGAVGLKIFKNLGMDLHYKDGRRVPVDDPMLDPVWEACGRLKIPVLIHTAEPWSFFQPIDKYNERWLELKTHPGRARPPDKYPSWETLMAEQEHIIAKHPHTIFISAHLAWRGNNLAALGSLLDRYPNMYTECGAVLYDLGRQPLTAHDFLVKYQDRVLFGKDTYAVNEYPYYFRVLETRDEYFDYYRKYHAFWQMYGLGLPDEVLKKLYYKNALRIVPGLNPTGFPE
ncbi:MAG TPA: amidohydrolase family protein [Bryobacterales bacterium]|jgi:predicted TIM-barrel fold metal-dependent hydrolase|nr:amidohydrolase family protein [Bryobacterales bacterium]